MRKCIVIVLTGLAMTAALTGCGGSGATPQTASSPVAADSATGSMGSDMTMPTPQAPQAVCDFKTTWEPLDAQLTKAEADLADTQLWKDTAEAMEAAPGPEAIANALGPLVLRVRKVADAVGSADKTEVMGVKAMDLPELAQLHTTVRQVFDQMCS
jgi:hypothetical protein